MSVNFAGRLMGVGGGAAVGAGLWAATDQTKNTPTPEEKLGAAVYTAAASAVAFVGLKYGKDGGVAKMSTYAASGMGVGAATGYALSAVAQLARS